MRDGRLKYALWGTLLVVGTLLSVGRGGLPVRDAAESHAAADGVAADLALYRDVIADVRTGRGYYEAARERIPQYGFPISSPLNWRLPTYAWLLSRLPEEPWIQAALAGLSVVA